MSDATEPTPAEVVASLPANVPPPLRAAVAAALGWVQQLDREAQAQSKSKSASVRRPR
jgi:hypothetical protein